VLIELLAKPLVVLELRRNAALTITHYTLAITQSKTPLRCGPLSDRKTSAALRTAMVNVQWSMVNACACA